MGLRVDPDEVREIISTSITDLNAFIMVANRMIEDHLGEFEILPSNELTTADGILPATLKEIERWLTAHFISIREKDARATEFKIEDASAKYGGQYGMGLKASLYGQTAMALDPTGELAAVNATRVKLVPIVLS